MNTISKAKMEEFLQLMDRIRDVAIDGTLSSVSDLDAHQLSGWLDDIIYTAQEARQALTPQTEQD